MVACTCRAPADYFLLIIILQRSLELDLGKHHNLIGYLACRMNITNAFQRELLHTTRSAFMSSIKFKFNINHAKIV